MQQVLIKITNIIFLIEFVILMRLIRQAGQKIYIVAV